MRLGSGQILGRRASQQDYFATLEREGATVLLLADGIGGLEGGDIASELAVKAFKASLERTGLTDLPGAFDTALRRANEAIAKASSRQGHEHGPERGQGRGMGTTFIALGIGERDVHWLSVGDSLVLRVRSGTVSRLNRQHTRMVQLQDKVRRGELSSAAAAADPQRDSITSALQGGPIPEIDRGEQARWDEDGFALASDGVLSIGFGPLQQALVADAAPQANVDALLVRVEAAADPGQDNTTVVFAMPGEETAPAVVPARPQRAWLAAIAAMLLLVPTLLWFLVRDPGRPPETLPDTAAADLPPEVVGVADGATPDTMIEAAPVIEPARPSTPEAPERYVVPVPADARPAPTPSGARGESRGVDYSKEPPEPEPVEAPGPLSTAPGRLSPEPAR